MRYVKVLLLVLFFFFVMLFFVQNQTSLSQAMTLRLDLMIMPPFESMPIPFYSLLLVSFLIGGLCTLLMLIWDRISLSARTIRSNMQAKSFEKDLGKSNAAHEQTKIELEKTRTALAVAEKKATEAEQELAKAKEAIVRSRAEAAGVVSFDRDR